MRCAERITEECRKLRYNGHHLHEEGKGEGERGRGAQCLRRILTSWASPSPRHMSRPRIDENGAALMPDAQQAQEQEVQPQVPSINEQQLSF